MTEETTAVAAKPDAPAPTKPSRKMEGLPASFEESRSTQPSEDVDAALDRLLGKEQITDLEDKPIEAKSTEPVEEGSEDDADTSAEAESTDGLDDAITVLRRDKIPMSVIKKMANKEIIALAAEKRTIQATIDNEFRELGELRKKESAEKAKAKEGESKGNAAPAEQPPSTFDISKLVEPFSKAFQDPELAGAYGEGLKGVYEAARAEARADLTKASEGFAPIVEAVRDLIFQGARQELRDQFPDLSKKDTYAKIKEQTTALLRTGHYETAEDAMSVACRVVLGSVANPDDAKRREGGKLMVGSRKVSSKPKTIGEAEDMALDVLLAGGTRADVERALNGG